MGMEEFIPPGFVPLANWDFRERKKQDGHSVEWKTLSDAVRDSEIPGFKLSNGRWYVHEQVSNEYLRKVLPPTTQCDVPVNNEVAVDTRHAESACASLASIDATLDEIYRALERLTTAVEKIAKHPLARLEDVGILEHDALPG